MTESQAFFRGLLLGIALLMTVAMAALFAVRQLSAFPAAAFFAAAATAFIAVDLGYLPLFANLLPEGAPWGSIRAVIEGLMLIGLLLCLISFPELRRRMPVAGNLVSFFAALSVALPVYAWFEPAPASGMARIVFGIAAVVGLVMLVSLWRRGYSRAEASLLAWSLLVLWTVFAAVAAMAQTEEGLYRALLAAGLVVVLVSMAFTMAQFAFGHGVMSRRFSEETGRRALALAGGKHFVWDWNVDSQEVTIGEEVDRALDLPRGAIAQAGTAGFLDLVHPLDRKAYLGAIENAEWRGRGSFAQDFRLRHGDGSYRWFRLQASAMPGADGRAARCVGTMTDVTGDKRSEERLLRDAVYDRVTGLPNRALLADRIERAIADAGQNKLSDLHLILIDLDRFKTVNDAMGHENGDTLLNVTGRRLISLAGPEDTVARLPGDQFGFLFVGSEPKREIVPFVDQLRKAVARPVALDGSEVFLTASLGIAQYRERGASGEDLLRDASVALYEAKRGGKDTFEFFSPAMIDDRSELFARETDLRRALERGEIEVHYQPIARLLSMELAGFEALVRWRHPGRGLLPPDQFIDIAEQTGLIRDIGRFVLAEAARQFGVWQRAFRPHDPLFCAVNVAASQLSAPGFADEAKAILAREAILPGTFKIEVTESAMMESPELAAKVLERLKTAGIGLACDDFGTGYSSFSTLRQLPFDTLKIDRGLAAHDKDDERAGVILESVLRMAHELGLVVVAEGITSEEQAQRLGGLGCDLGQGFYIGPPMGARQVTDALGGLPYDANRDRSVVEALRERAAAPEPPPRKVAEPLPMLTPIPTPSIVRDIAPPPPLDPPKRDVPNIPPPKPVVPVAPAKTAAAIATIMVHPKEMVAANGGTDAETRDRPGIGAAPMAPRMAKPEPPPPAAEPVKPRRKRKARKKPKRRAPEPKVTEPTSEG
jgi:diguanylate cyclase (GGDEF)-like protein